MQPAPTKEARRLRRLVREPDKVESLATRDISERSLLILELLRRFQFLPTSLILKLIGGNERVTHRHLQALFHKSFVARLVLPSRFKNTEFIYYLDTPETLRLLVQYGIGDRVAKEDLDIVERNREKDYAHLHKRTDYQGELLFLNHELMITRFHAMLALTCKSFGGKVELSAWRQGARCWNRVKAAKIVPVPNTKPQQYRESSEEEWIPHRPDAFFSLRFNTVEDGDRERHFFYEADRGTENTTRLLKKLRGHFCFIAKKKLHQEFYGVDRIRAVLVETTSSSWAEKLKDVASHPGVSLKPSPLFLTTSSAHFTDPQTILESGRERQVPLYLTKPQQVFQRIWHCPTEPALVSILD